MKSDTRLASNLRHRIIIEQPNLATDGAGGFTQSWEPFAEVWAAVEPKNGREQFSGEKLNPTRNFVITIRYLEGVTADMRIRFGDRLFDIQSILNPYEENVLLEITAEEGE